MFSSSLFEIKLIWLGISWTEILTFWSRTFGYGCEKEKLNNLLWDQYREKILSLFFLEKSRVIYNFSEEYFTFSKWIVTILHLWIHMITEVSSLISSFLVASLKKMNKSLKVRLKITYLSLFSLRRIYRC